jgi:peptide/nickel transport system substrate-binding protein
MISRRSALSLAAITLWACTNIAHAAPKPPAVDRDTVVMAVGKGFDSLDPQVVTTGSSQRYAWQMFDTLYAFDDTGNMIPRLATSYTISPDKLQYTFKLRGDVKFHNGEVMTSADVKYSLERILEPKTRSTRRPNFEPVVASVEAPSADTVVFKLKVPDGAFLNKIAGYLYIVPKKYTEALETPEAFGRKPVGTGPYKLVEQKIGQRLVIERFDDYFGPKPAIKRIVFNFIPEPASRINALLTGEADLADLLPTVEIERLKKTPGIDVMPIAIGSPLGVKFYTVDKSSPVSNRDVRLALNYAVDTNAIIKSVFHGAGKPIATYISSYYPYGVDPQLKPLGYDPKKARELLRKAGYPNGLQVTLNGGNDMPKELYEVIAAYWSAVGVKTKLNVIDYTAWIRMNNNHQSGPITVMQFSNAIYDPIHVYYGAAAKDGSWSNYYNPEVEALIDESSQMVERDQRDAVFKKIGKLLRDDAFTVPITELFIVFGKNSNLDWKPQVGISWYNLRKLAWKQ